MFPRADLIRQLKLVEPGLASKDVIPALSCFAFDGESVMAYNEILALRAPCATPGFEGGIPGATLLKFLGACGGKTVELVKDGDLVQIKCGRSKLELAYLDPEMMLFEEPVKDAFVELPTSTEFLGGLQRVMVSMGIDALHPWRLGVSLKMEGRTCSFFSTNNLCLTRAAITLPKKTPTADVVLVPRFCELLVEHCKTSKLEKLMASNAWLIADFEDGLRLFARTMENASIAKFEKMFKTNQGESEPELAPVPKLLHRCLARAEILLDTKHDFSVFNIKGGRLRVTTEHGSSSSKVVDLIKIDHGDIEVSTDPKLIAAALPFASRIGFTAKSVVLEDEEASFCSLIAVR